MLTLRELIDTLPRAGVVEWIGLRPGRLEMLRAVANADAAIGRGLVGDHYSKRDGKRQVTLIQAEHLQAIASMLGVAAVDPASLRRNLVIRGINLLALKDKQFQVGETILEYSGLCHPCSRMETTLGPGGYNALRGHGGITARVLRGGTIRVGSSLMQSLVKLASTGGHA